MRVLFINPPWVVERTRNVWRNVASVMPPLGLAWLAAVLEDAGHSVRILDAHAEHLFIDQIPQWIREHGPFELAGITATTPLIENAKKIARLLKSEWPEMQIVLGGVHPTVLPDEVLAESAIDVVVRGEGEVTITELAGGKPLEGIYGISYRSEGQIIHNGERKLIPKLDDLPLPAYHLLPMSRYRPAAGAAKRTPASSILATRGCPGRCTFCYRQFGAALRVRSGAKVAEEVFLLQDRYGIREVCFYDDTFTSSKREVKAFCEALGARNADLTWSCFSRIDTVNEELLRIMKEHGCHQVMYGVETYNPEILSNINKRVRAEKIEQVVSLTKEVGIDVRAAFMLGNPGETAETMEQNIRFAIRLDPEIAQFNIATPFPGTEMFRWAQENGYLMTQDWKDYDLSTPILRLPTVSPEEVLRYYRIAHRRFYLRPKYVWKRLLKMRDPEALSSAVRGVRMLLHA